MPREDGEEGGWGRARYGEVDQEEEKGRKTKSGH